MCATPPPVSAPAAPSLSPLASSLPETSDAAPAHIARRPHKTRRVPPRASQLVLFVGEALVGNEAVDQVRGFNQALSEYSASREPRLIDGIMLTKFDTINDKVGAALSLVYTTGKPIVFVGVGQTYTDIRNLNVDHCVRALLRG